MCVGLVYDSVNALRLWGHSTFLGSRCRIWCRCRNGEVLEPRGQVRDLEAEVTYRGVDSVIDLVDGIRILGVGLVDKTFGLSSGVVDSTVNLCVCLVDSTIYLIVELLGHGVQGRSLGA